VTVNRLLRATWLSGVAGRCRRTTGRPSSAVYLHHHMHSGRASGEVFGYVRSETLRSRRIRAAIDVTIPAFIDPVLPAKYVIS
jgi:hypothetical protein